MERGGPALDQQKNRKGFGSSLLINVPKSLGGEAVLELDNTGLSYSLLVPTDSIQTAEQGLPAHSGPDGRQTKAAKAKRPQS